MDREMQLAGSVVRQPSLISMAPLEPHDTQTSEGATGGMYFQAVAPAREGNAHGKATNSSLVHHEGCCEMPRLEPTVIVTPLDPSASEWSSF